LKVVVTGTKEEAPVVVSVNTGTIHIAAAVQTPVVVLYAQTNPQHTPWQVQYEMLEYEVAEELRSRNEVIQHLYKTVYNTKTEMPLPGDIVRAVQKIWNKPEEKSPNQLSRELMSK